MKLSGQVSNDCYPFWGKPASVNIPCLSAKKMVVTEKLLPELRITEQWCNAQSTWKLYTAGSVGSQVDKIILVSLMRAACHSSFRRHYWESLISGKSDFKEGCQIMSGSGLLKQDFRLN